MSMKKTVRVPLLPEGVPVVTHDHPAERTREIAEDLALSADAPPGGDPDVPEAVLTDDITVPVHSSIESSVTFELLRRQSTSTDDEGKG
jgi:hypothetical protein